MARYTTKLGQRMIVMVLRICRQRSPPPAPQQRHFCSYLRTLSNLATESLPIAPDSIRVAFSQQSNLSYKHMVNSAVGANGHMGHAMNCLSPAMSDMFQSYCNTCISKCCLLVGRDNRSKQALPARSPFVTPLYTIE